MPAYRESSVNTPLSMILPGNLPASTAPPGLEQAEIGLKRKRAGAAKYKQGREVRILRRLALASLEIYSYTYVAGMQ